MPAHKSITLQVANVRDRPASIISDAIKELKNDKDSGAPDVPGLHIPQDDFGTFLTGCPDFVCPEEQFIADLTSLDAGTRVLDNMVPDGSNYKTPVRSSDLMDVWFDNLPAQDGVHYDKVDESTITPKTPLAPGTAVTSRFLKY